MCCSNLQYSDRRNSWSLVDSECLLLNIGLLDEETELLSLADVHKHEARRRFWLARKPFCETEGSGGQFAGLMDALHPLPNLTRTFVKTRLTEMLFNSYDLPWYVYSAGISLIEGTRHWSLDFKVPTLDIEIKRSRLTISTQKFRYLVSVMKFIGSE